MTVMATTYAHEMALREISDAALQDDCGVCWSEPGKPCVTEFPSGTHEARFARAMRHSFITMADLRIVVAALGVFTGTSVLYVNGQVAA